jgi:hypothetical protein
MYKEEKTKSPLSIDKEVFEKSHDLGLNVSKACESYLITLNQTIESSQNTKALSRSGFSAEKVIWCGCRDLNPGRQRGRLMS